MTRPRDIRPGDCLLDPASRHRAYYVEATDAPSLGMLTVIQFDPFDPHASATVREWVTARALVALAQGRLILGGRDHPLPHIDRASA